MAFRALSLLVVSLLLACGSSSSGSSTGSAGTSASGGSTGTGGSSSTGGAGVGGSGSGACPDISGSWKITAHCDASLIGQALLVTQTGCKVTLAPPFDQFMATLGPDGALALSGPQTCTGTASPTAISETCTPGTCVVTLGR